jgi:hypothetical protein
MRDWALTSGESMRGEIEMVDEIAGTVRLRSDDGKESVVQMDQFSNIDRAWILEWLELGEELKELIKKFGGRMEHFEGKGATLTTGFHVYHPSGAIAPGTPRPMMILFDPAGKPERYLTRHLEAAEQTKITLVTCEHIRNGQTAEETLARFKELFPLIQKSVPHDPKRIFLGGTSGGALNAFYFPASMPEIPWAGIYSNGGWLGAEYERPYPATKVAMVNGDRDVAANGWLDADSAVLQKRGATVVVIAFEGAHQIPPVSVQVKAFKWLLGELK